MERLRTETLQMLQNRESHFTNFQSSSDCSRVKTEQKYLPQNFDLPPSYEDPPSYNEAKKIKKYYKY